MIENQFSFKIKTFRSDGGVEFTSNDFRSYLSQHVLLIISLSLIHLSKMVLLKKKHRHIIETTVTLLSQASMPYPYWTFVAQIAVNLINMLPTSVLGWKSPWSKLYFSPPDLTQLKIFGCACYPNLRPYTAHKLEPRTKECIFIGYPTSSKGYFCLDHQKNHVYTSRHVIFNESKFPFSSTVTSISSTSSNATTIPTWLSNQLYLHSTNQPFLLGSYPSLPINPSSNTQPSQSAAKLSLLPTSNSNPESSPSHTNSPSPSAVEPSLLPTSNTHPKPLPPYILNSHPMQTKSKSGITYKATIDYTYTEPISYKIALRYPKWCEAMDAEFQALQR